MSTTPHTSVTSRLALPQTVRSAKPYRRFQAKLRRPTIRRRVIRSSLLAANLVILAVIVAFVLQNPHTSTRGTAKASLLSASSTSTVATNPLDQLSSADIALTVARLSSLPETTAITNQVQSQAADLAIAASNDNVTSKPQVVATALKSRADIKDYVAQAGDTVSSIAAKFEVTSDSIRWSNNLSGDAVTPGTKLVIPPVSGIVYTVKPGDTPDSVASHFRSNRDKLIAYNDAEISGLTPGERIIIPDATKVTAPTTAANIATGFAWGSSPIYGYNGYDYGYCTWYVATQIPVPANWGNASTWAYFAGLSGWNPNARPVVGAIAQKGGGWGHVAIVDAVSADGSMIKIRDMNGVAGWGRVGYSDWISASHYQHFITR